VSNIIMLGTWIIFIFAASLTAQTMPDIHITEIKPVYIMTGGSGSIDKRLNEHIGVSAFPGASIQDNDFLPILILLHN
jgi:hypothetical protein